MSEINHFKVFTMQDYVTCCSGDLTIGGWYDSWQLVDDVYTLHVKRIAVNDL
jgi:hypothetical protein